SKRAFTGAGHALRSAAAGVEFAGGPGSPGSEVMTAPLKFGAALVGTIDKVREFTDSLHQSNMQFAEFSGSMAAVQAQSDARDFNRSTASGDSRSASASRLAN